MGPTLALEHTLSIVYKRKKYIYTRYIFLKLFLGNEKPHPKTEEKINEYFGHKLMEAMAGTPVSRWVRGW